MFDDERVERRVRTHTQHTHLIDPSIIPISLPSHPFRQVTARTVAALLAMEALDPKAEITMYINSSGGSPYSVVAILDMMAAIAPPIRTVAFGQVATAPTLLLAAGTKGRRFAMPSTRIMLYQPIGGAEGSADEVNITTTELHRTMRLCNAFLSRFTGKEEEQLEEESDRPNCMSAEQAVSFGLIDGVLETMKGQ
jgi:ATP-dependent Clp protease, protease subunit